MVLIGNHEYDYFDGKGNSGSQNDPSGADQPYHPLWGNFGAESGGECGVMTSKHFLMPSGASNKQAMKKRVARQPQAGLSANRGQVVSDLTQARLLDGGGTSGKGAEMFTNFLKSLAGVTQPATDAVGRKLRSGRQTMLSTSKTKWQEDRHQIKASDVGDQGDSLGYFGPTDNPPFWYSFDYGIVHFTMVSTEHDLSPGSLQYEWLQVGEPPHTAMMTLLCIPEQVLALRKSFLPEI